MSLVRFRFWARRCSSMVEHQPSKLNTWVRFPSPALKMNILFIMREWLSWWSTTLPRSGSRVRVPSRALLIYKRYPKRIPFVYKRVLPDSNGSRSPLCSGRCRTDIHRMSCTVSRSIRKRLEPIYMQESCRTRTVRIYIPLRSVQGQDYFFSFIRNEGVAGAFFQRNKSTYWPLAWLVLNSETHV